MFEGRRENMIHQRTEVMSFTVSGGSRSENMGLLWFPFHEPTNGGDQNLNK